MKFSTFEFGPARLGSGVVLFVLLVMFGAWPIYAQRSEELNGNSLLLSSMTPSDQTHKTSSASAAAEHMIPVGTILPVVLRTAISFEKSQPGQVLQGKIAQDVPLQNGLKINKGSAIEGHVVELAPATSDHGAIVSIQFDKVYVAGQWIPVVTNLRAVAGFMEVLEAAVPTETGAPVDWLPTTQVGGDTVYGLGGPVMSAEDASEVIGKSIGGDGVLARASGKEGTKCRGAMEGNDNPQALWVFSGDACGAYGLEHLKILHAGRTDPMGTIVLASEKRNMGLRNGDGLLLRVDR
jgi:hypothetical protein